MASFGEVDVLANVRPTECTLHVLSFNSVLIAQANRSYFIISVIVLLEAKSYAAAEGSTASKQDSTESRAWTHLRINYVVAIIGKGDRTSDGHDMRSDDNIYTSSSS